ncbi:hypothetical protein [Pseudorhodoferax soli]|uniref:hypothetical protein n=1 Tax=Pseudorhodoferax soli TaxID=545864 RepID=UPI000DF226F6|nr:hypothetical protein [Pseudorhodoferax soli]
MARGIRTAKEHGPFTRERANLEPTQLIRPDLGQPGDDRPCCVRLDELLCGLQPLRRRIGLKPDELSLVQSHMLQAWKVWVPGRTDDHYLTASLNHLAERRCQKPLFADGWRSCENLGDGTTRPPATGQRYVQCGPSRRHGFDYLVAQYVATPDCFSHVRREPQHPAAIVGGVGRGESKDGGHAPE